MSGVPKPAAAAIRFIQLLNLDDPHGRHRQNQHLRDPHPATVNADRPRLIIGTCTSPR